MNSAPPITVSQIVPPSITLNDLPEDVLTRIFTLAIEPDGAQLTKDVGPFRLARVCTLWENHINHSSLLWRTIIIHLLSMPPGLEIADLSELLKQILEHAGTAPLQITFTSSRCFGHYTDEHAHTLLKQLLAKSSQWETAKVSVAPDVLLELDRPHGRDFSLLSDLSLRTWRYHSHLVPVSMFRAAPIRTLSLDGIDSDKVLVRWDALRTLTNLDNADNDLRILTSTPRLTTYAAECTYRTPVWLRPSQQRTVRLERLRSVTLWGPTVGEMERLQFELPGLQSASVDLADDPTVVSLVLVANLIGYGYPRCAALRVLHIHGLDLVFACRGSVCLMGILQAVEALETLSLAHRAARRRQQSVSHALVGALVEAMTRTPGKACLLPRLSAVGVELTRSNVDLAMEWGAIRRMWDSRQDEQIGMQDGVRLETLFFADGRAEMRDGVLSVRPLRRERCIGKKQHQDVFDEVDDEGLWANSIAVDDA